MTRISTDEDAERELQRLRWVERQVAEQVKNWKADSDGLRHGYAEGLADCAQEITDIIEASFGLPHDAGALTARLRAEAGA